MKAEIIAVGTELLLGNIVNTNAQFLSVELASLGFDMYYQTVVGDNFDRLVGQIRESVGRSDVVLITGGLGPTPDDLSKEAAAAALGLELLLDENSLASIKEYYRKVGRQMSESNIKQAMFPKERCVIFPNANGTAPGCAMTADNGSIVMLMPGVPFEMKRMFESSVKPLLATKSNRTIVSKSILVAGIGESLLASKIPEYINMTDPTVSPYCKPALVTLRVTSADETKELAEGKCKKVGDELCKIFGKNVCGIDTKGIEYTVVDLLRFHGKRLATAESCTAGLVSSKITAVPGASEVFDFGASTYSNTMKQKLLGVGAETLRIHGAVSAETACQMAEGIRRYAEADIGLSVTGVAGPGQSESKPAGLVFIALSDGEHTWVEKLTVGNASNDREKVRNTATATALDLVRRYLSYLPETMPRFTQSHDPVPFIPEEAAIGEAHFK